MCIFFFYKNNKRKMRQDLVPSTGNIQVLLDSQRVVNFGIRCTYIESS